MFTLSATNIIHELDEAKIPLSPSERAIIKTVVHTNYDCTLHYNRYVIASAVELVEEFHDVKYAACLALATAESQTPVFMHLALGNGMIAGTLRNYGFSNDSAKTIYFKIYVGSVYCATNQRKPKSKTKSALAESAIESYFDATLGVWSIQWGVPVAASVAVLCAMLAFHTVLGTGIATMIGIMAIGIMAVFGWPLGVVLLRAYQRMPRTGVNASFARYRRLVRDGGAALRLRHFGPHRLALIYERLLTQEEV